MRHAHHVPAFGYAVALPHLVRRRCCPQLAPLVTPACSYAGWLVTGHGGLVLPPCHTGPALVGLLTFARLDYYPQFVPRFTPVVLRSYRTFWFAVRFTRPTHGYYPVTGCPLLLTRWWDCVPFSGCRAYTVYVTHTPHLRACARLRGVGHSPFAVRSRTTYGLIYRTLPALFADCRMPRLVRYTLLRAQLRAVCRLVTVAGLSCRITVTDYFG